LSDYRLQLLPSAYDEELLSLSVVVPAYNEEQRLPASLTSIETYLQTRPLTDYEILVVDDGSTDGTARCVQEFARDHRNVRLLSNESNRGKGFSVRHGMLASQGAWVLFTDADLSAPISELPKLEGAVQGSAAAVAIGSRALDPNLVGVHQPAGRELAGRIFNLTMRAVTGLPFLDTQCGFKLYRRDAAQAIFSRQRLDGFGFDVEDLYLARVLGFYVVEVPVRWNNVEGTKVSLGHGLKSFLDPVVVRWNHLRGLYSDVRTT
jgi:glycosyltransferase involved in cell wall biosynthesis